jgi:hypothetical protein
LKNRDKLQVKHLFHGVLFCGVFFMVLFCISCGGSKSDHLDIPMDMPEICQSIDFTLDLEMRKVCGVKVRNFRSYKNVPKYRLLSRPKGGKIVKSGNVYKLSLPSMLPARLPASVVEYISFDENQRSQYLQTSYEYQEFLPNGTNKRTRIIRLEIPTINGRKESVCYIIRSKPKKVSNVQAGYANQPKLMKCSVFEKYK